MNNQDDNNGLEKLLESDNQNSISGLGMLKKSAFRLEKNELRLEGDWGDNLQLYGISKPIALLDNFLDKKESDGDNLGSSRDSITPAPSVQKTIFSSLGGLGNFLWKPVQKVSNFFSKPQELAITRLSADSTSAPQTNLMMSAHRRHSDSKLRVDQATRTTENQSELDKVWRSNCHGYLYCLGLGTLLLGNDKALFAEFCETILQHMPELLSSSESTISTFIRDEQTISMILKEINTEKFNVDEWDVAAQLFALFAKSYYDGPSNSEQKASLDEQSDSDISYIEDGLLKASLEKATDMVSMQFGEAVAISFIAAALKLQDDENTLNQFEALFERIKANQNVSASEVRQLYNSLCSTLHANWSESLWPIVEAIVDSTPHSIGQMIYSNKVVPGLIKEKWTAMHQIRNTLGPLLSVLSSQELEGMLYALVTTAKQIPIYKDLTRRAVEAICSGLLKANKHLSYLNAKPKEEAPGTGHILDYSSEEQKTDQLYVFSSEDFTEASKGKGMLPQLRGRKVPPKNAKYDFMMCYGTSSDSFWHPEHPQPLRYFLKHVCDLLGGAAALKFWVSQLRLNYGINDTFLELRDWNNRQQVRKEWMKRYGNDADDFFTKPLVEQQEFYSDTIGSLLKSDDVEMFYERVMLGYAAMSQLLKILASEDECKTVMVRAIASLFAPKKKDLMDVYRDILQKTVQRVYYLSLGMFIEDCFRLAAPVWLKVLNADVKSLPEQPITNSANGTLDEALRYWLAFITLVHCELVPDEVLEASKGSVLPSFNRLIKYFVNTERGEKSRYWEEKSSDSRNQAAIAEYWGKSHDCNIDANEVFQGMQVRTQLGGGLKVDASWHYKSFLSQGQIPSWVSINALSAIIREFGHLPVLQWLLSREKEAMPAVAPKEWEKVKEIEVVWNSSGGGDDTGSVLSNPCIILPDDDDRKSHFSILDKSHYSLTNEEHNSHKAFAQDKQLLTGNELYSDKVTVREIIQLFHNYIWLSNEECFNKVLKGQGALKGLFGINPLQGKVCGDGKEQGEDETAVIERFVGLILKLHDRRHLLRFEADVLLALLKWGAQQVIGYADDQIKDISHKRNNIEKAQTWNSGDKELKEKNLGECERQKKSLRELSDSAKLLTKYKNKDITEEMVEMARILRALDYHAVEIGLFLVVWHSQVQSFFEIYRKKLSVAINSLLELYKPEQCLILLAIADSKNMPPESFLRILLIAGREEKVAVKNSVLETGEGAKQDKITDKKEEVTGNNEGLEHSPATKEEGDFLWALTALNTAPFCVSVGNKPGYSMYKELKQSNTLMKKVKEGHFLVFLADAIVLIISLFELARQNHREVWDNWFYRSLQFYIPKGLAGGREPQLLPQPDHFPTGRPSDTVVSYPNSFLVMAGGHQGWVSRISSRKSSIRSQNSDLFQLDSEVEIKKTEQIGGRT